MRNFRPAVILWILMVAIIRADDEPKLPRVIVSRATTYFKEPLDKHGDVDYETALNERLRGKITPDRNVVVLLLQVIGQENRDLTSRDLKWLGLQAVPAPRDSLVPDGGFTPSDPRVKVPNGQEFERQRELAGDGPWKAETYPYLAAWLHANDKPLAIVAAAARRDQYFNPHTTEPEFKGSSLLSNNGTLSDNGAREIIRTLRCRAMLRLGEGLPDDAWDDLITGHRLGRFMTHGAHYLEYLVGIALERVIGETHRLYLENCRLSARQLRRHLDEMQRLPEVGSLDQLYELGDRVRVLDVLRFMRHGHFEILEGEGELKFQLAPLTAEQQRQLANLDWNEIHRLINRRHDRTVQALKIPDRTARQKALQALRVEGEAAKGPKSGYASLANFLFEKTPGRTSAAALVDRSLHTFNSNLALAEPIQLTYDLVAQHTLNRRVAYALVIYRREHRQFPDRLAELVPQYLPTIPLDMFSGRPLIYRAKGEGFLLYSVGNNQKDDQGRNIFDEPPGDDVRFRIDRLLPGSER